jgi:hypothetical protein
VRPVEFGEVILQMEPPEAGRYHAPILIVPGLFQSLACWRPFTSMLAHRGWEVYTLARQAIEGDDEPIGGGDHDFAELVDLTIRAIDKLGDKVIVFGADVGASIALAALERARPMAMALFAPADRRHAGEAYARSLGFLERRRTAKAPGPIEPPAALKRGAPLPTLPAAEPRALVRSLLDDAAGAKATPDADSLPPTIVFGVGDDPLVANDHAAAFVRGPHMKLASTHLSGRWWPTLAWRDACDESHRFLILTLGDRVVEFPDEILED